MPSRSESQASEAGGGRGSARRRDHRREPSADQDADAGVLGPRVRTEEFRALFSGKEIGHRIADYVDERTTQMLEESFTAVHELDSAGRVRARSMGDLWLQSGGIYNPINVKAGEAGKNGQPNMVSLTKLLDALLRHQIDSYYLLIVKMRLSSVPASAEVPESRLTPDEIAANVYLVDMLEYLDYITFDAGPGQTMLRERQFYEAADSGWRPPKQTIGNKVSRLIDLLEDGDRRLIENRRKKMERLRAGFLEYQARGALEVHQEDLNLG